MAEKPIIEVQGLTKRFKGLTAVHDVSFSVEKGSITGMIGPNGAGKSTTFNMICGYYPPTEGKIFYNGEDITNKKAYEYTNMKIARTFQIMKPLKNLSVLDNVTAAASSVSAGFKPAMFSSRNSTSGLVARARAISRRFWSGVPMSLEIT